MPRARFDMTKPLKRRDTLRRLERAAMEWFLTTKPKVSKPNIYSGQTTAFCWPSETTMKLHEAAAAHAAAKEKRGKK